MATVVVASDITSFKDYYKKLYYVDASYQSMKDSRHQAPAPTSLTARPAKPPVDIPQTIATPRVLAILRQASLFVKREPTLASPQIRCYCYQQVGYIVTNCP